MKLPAGATGFDPPSDAHTNLGRFTAVCRQAARDIAATVTDVTPAGVTPNFHTIDIRHAEQHVSVLLLGVELPADRFKVLFAGRLERC